MDVAVLMTDYNLITIPVVDDKRQMLGVIARPARTTATACCGRCCC